MTDANQIFIDIPENDQYAELRRIKKQNGLTWRGLLLQGARRVDNNLS